MEKDEMIQQVRAILKEQLKTKDAGNGQMRELDDLLSSLREKHFNANFSGTVEEIHAYTKTALETNSKDKLQAHVEHHHLNLSRWLEELNLLKAGGGAVTIDYEQRKGREI
ncbi:hypothetical protein MM300_03645 [Evansella sp. LMS18]|uniref:hypothetical protein n=1 Tax=Evansella sp. LMS18 TaxID=2924033 RepID=UPI0020D186B6|nr:hypothetical protein [Evansella sp. LMS18]UTR11436.1 hypothetical protein MM300_03645 [Evansella sp. LMS18]